MISLKRLKHHWRLLLSLYLIHLLLKLKILHLMKAKVRRTSL